MNRLIYIVWLLVCASCHNSNQLDIVPLLPWNQWTGTADSIASHGSYIAIDDNDILLPTLTKACYIITEDTIFYSSSDSIAHLPGDKVKVVGSDSYNLSFSSRLSFRDDGVYLYSPNMLSNCFINLYYSAGLVSCAHNKLEYIVQDGELYTYRLLYSDLDKGSYPYLSALSVHYYPSIDMMSCITSRYYNGLIIEPSEILIGHPDMEKYCKPLLPYLALNWILTTKTETKKIQLWLRKERNRLRLNNLQNLA